MNSSTSPITPKDDELIERPSWMTEREISHDEAKLIAQRLINSHFNNDDRAHVSIPANPDRDDDLLILTYIMQQRQAASRIAELKAALEAIRDVEPEKIGDTGFVQGPALLLAFAKRRAASALSNPPSGEVSK